MRIPAIPAILIILSCLVHNGFMAGILMPWVSQRTKAESDHFDHRNKGEYLSGALEISLAQHIDQSPICIQPTNT